MLKAVFVISSLTLQASQSEIPVSFFFQGLGGQDGGGRVPRGRQRDHAGRLGRTPLGLHVRRSRETQGNAQENYIHTGHAAAQPNLRTELKI